MTTPFTRVNIVSDGAMRRMSPEEYTALREELDQGFAWPEHPDDWQAVDGSGMLLRPEEVTAILNAGLRLEVVQRQAEVLRAASYLAPVEEESLGGWGWLILTLIVLVFIVAITR